MSGTAGHNEHASFLNTGIQANESYMMILVMMQQSCGIITNHQYDVISAHKIISQS